MDHTTLVQNLGSAWWIATAAFIAPFIAYMTGRRIPDVVWLLLFGILIGPHMLHLAQGSEAIHFLRELGLGILFFLAGMEINLSDLRDPAGLRAKYTWVAGFALAILLSLIITGWAIDTSLALGIALTSTALGALLPILKEANRLDLPIGQVTLRVGAIGELYPIIAMTLLLSSRATYQSAILLLFFALLSILIVGVPNHLIKKIPILNDAMQEGLHNTTQSALRLAIFLLLSLMYVSAAFHLDVVLGAFTTGLLANRMLSEKGSHFFVKKLETLGFSFLIPLFFVTSGMRIDFFLVLHHIDQLLYVVIALCLCRVLPVFIGEYIGKGSLYAYTNQVLEKECSYSWREKLALGFYAGTGLPIIVAVTEVAIKSQLITEDFASLLIAGGMCTVLLFPLISELLLRAQESQNDK